MGLPIDKAGFQSSASNRVEKFSLAAGRIVYLPSWVVGKERTRLLHSASGTNNENVSLRAASKAWECEGKVRHFLVHNVSCCILILKFFCNVGQLASQFRLDEMYAFWY